MNPDGNPVRALVQVSAARSLQYLEEAHQLAPDDVDITEDLFGRYADLGQYARALGLLDQLRSSTALYRAARILQQGRPGVPRNDSLSLTLLQRAATLEVKTHQQPDPPALMALYGAVCRKAISKERIGPLFVPSRWQLFQQFSVNCTYNPGG
ncbi:hypothetical protein [Deinococcus maricopensis]|uniref:Sel1 domain protein repeat-containing protein n=1 Tax=Deinococcus maricopensis (strain DSM 21211 / LMG 22137 / NRRL B-23946 / LB-34) TaxID=709986 RepID=E8U4P6_DEIML|nr:hypothetical protein [Deinococcus maricopensis]ADV68911.1 Sel1 domain protein repeat-containing protein [Deinococcus maricopensis DSM 21211]